MKFRPLTDPRMQRIRYIMLPLVALVALKGPVSTAEPLQPSDERSIVSELEAYVERESDSKEWSDAELGTLVDQRFDELVGQRKYGAFERLNDHQLDDLFTAAQSASFYSLSAESVTKLDRIFGVLKSRGAATTRHAQLMIEAFLSQRQFWRARAIADEFGMNVQVPLLTDLTEPHNSSKPTLLTINPERSILVRRKVSIDPDALTVLIVGSPFCGFFRAAHRDIFQDEQLASLVLNHAIWIVPQSGRLGLSQITGWNEQHPYSPLKLAFKNSEWTWIDTWTTPTFYFVRNGRVARKIKGWPSSDTTEVLRRAFSDLLEDD